MILSGADILVNCLIEQGVDVVFGYPGGAVLDIYDALYRSGKIEHVLTAHEQGAAHAADGYARVSGKTGVCIATSGPGATNLVTGIATAYMDSVPLVAVTGNVSLDLLGRDSFQEVDACGITMPVTKHNFIVKNVEELADTLRQAFHIANSGRKGPVLVDILKNVQVAECEYTPTAPRKNSVCGVDKAKTEQAAAAIKQSKKPVIIAGGGVISSNASENLKKFACDAGCPVAYTLMGKGCIADGDELCLGMAGMHGTFAAVKALNDCDTIIALGTRFSDRVALNRENFGKNKTIIHVDIDNAEMNKNVTASIRVLADVNEFLKELIPLVGKADRKEWLAEVANNKKNDLKNLKDTRAAEIIRHAASLAPEGTPLVTDVGQHQMWAAQHYALTKPRTFCSSGGLGTMGYGMGAAVGAAFARKKGTCVLITGDGSITMNMNEISTAAREGLPLVILLMDNGVLGMVRQWQKIFYSRRFSQTTLARKIDYVKLAESLGGAGMVLDEKDDVKSVLEKAFFTAESERVPVLVDCKISQDENVLPMIKPGRTYAEQIRKMEKD